MKQIKKMMQRGLMSQENDDPFAMFVASTNIRYCYYADTTKVYPSPPPAEAPHQHNSPTHSHLTQPASHPSHPRYSWWCSVEGGPHTCAVTRDGASEVGGCTLLHTHPHKLLPCTDTPHS